jgi:hypothetical protein
MACSLNFVEIEPGSYSRCDQHHHFDRRDDLSRRITPAGSGTVEMDLLRSLTVGTITKGIGNKPDREEADDSPQAALHIERRTLVDALISGLKSDGVWTKLDNHKR